jgi:catecholate siderophore receptor
MRIFRDVPQTVNVVTADVMSDQHATSMQDALKNVPGVSFSHAGRAP